MMPGGKGQETRKLNALKRFMAAACDSCPLCRYAREKPETAFGRIIQWHGRWCPFWKAREEVYGTGQANNSSSGSK